MWNESKVLEVVAFAPGLVASMAKFCIKVVCYFARFISAKRYSVQI